MALTRFEDVADVTTEDYFNGNQMCINVFYSKYTHFLQEEERRETPPEVFKRNAGELARFESDPKYEEMWFDLMYNDWFRPGGSILSGLGSGRNESLLNCTTLPIKGDSLEDISEAEYSLMKCAAYRQGIGMELSPLRWRGAKIGNAAEESTGVIPWGKKLSNVGIYVGQRGRMPAVLESLLISHPDIEEFITSKLEKGELENCNISVQIPDDFMDCLKNNKPWKLCFSTHRETFEKEVDPSYLVDLIANTAAQSAEPGVQFIDLMRRGSMVNAIYESTGDERFRVISSNACSEKPLPPYGVCNLGSINMEKFSTDPDQYKQELSQIAPYLVRFLDDVVSYELEFNKSPLEAQKWILEQTREIGLGVTNLHGWLLKQDIQYDSDEAIELVEDFFKTYSFCIFRSSVELGRERGPAPALERVSSIKNLYENSTYFKNIVDEFYGGDYTKVDSLRNLAHMSNAPTGSLSNTFSTPCIASGVEPIIGPWYWRKTRAVTKGTYEYYFVIPERVKEYVLKQIPNDSEDYQKLYDFPGSVKDDDGKIGKEFVELIQSYVSDEFFKPAHQIDYYKKIDLMSRLYKWMDAAISCTFNLPPSATKDDVQDIYLYAYDKGVRAVSVYVEGSREGILIFDDPVTHKNKQAKQNLLCLNRPEDIVYHCAPKRPESLECDIHHCTVKGEKWLVLVGIFNGKPYEVFCGTQEDLYLPRSITTGTITKEKSQYNLVIQNKRTNVKYENIADILMTAEQKALTRMLSLSLRHGVPLEFITKQLRKSKNDITDFASVVSRVLGRYETQSLEEEEKCPSCGEPMVKQEGCIQCMNQECGYSRCS